MLTGVVHALGTSWGLFRHYWIVAKLVLVVIATIILIAHLPAVSRMATMAATAVTLDQDSVMSRLQFVVHAAGGTGILLLVTTISVFKPWGRTSHGRRMAATG